ncbi:MAG: hypothetical protein J5J06_14575 [Phycisphaerae bacterium]|nr:hypothetical protein [Phycisphaerae bacterium]
MRKQNERGIHLERRILRLRCVWHCMFLPTWLVFAGVGCASPAVDWVLTAENAHRWVILPSHDDFRAEVLRIADSCVNDTDEFLYRIASLRPREWVIISEDSEVFGKFASALLRLEDGRVRFVTNYWKRALTVDMGQWPECDVLCDWVKDSIQAVGAAVAPYAIERDPIRPQTRNVLELANRLSELPIPATDVAWAGDDVAILTVSWQTDGGQGQLVFDTFWVGSWRDRQELPQDRRVFDSVHQIWTLLLQESTAESPPVWHIRAKLPKDVVPERSASEARSP